MIQQAQTAVVCRIAGIPSSSTGSLEEVLQDWIPERHQDALRKKKSIKCVTDWKLNEEKLSESAISLL